MNLSERRRVESQFHYRRSPNNRETVPHDNRGHQPNCSQHKNIKGLPLAICGKQSNMYRDNMKRFGPNPPLQ